MALPRDGARAFAGAHGLHQRAQPVLGQALHRLAAEATFVARAIDNEMKAGYGKDKAAREGEVRFVMSQDGAAQLAGAFVTKLTGAFTKYKPTGEDLDGVALIGTERWMRERLARHLSRLDRKSVV